MPKTDYISDNKGKEQPEIKFIDPLNEVNKRFDFYIKVVIGILVFTVLTMLVMVSTLVIDSFHINSAIYNEYSAQMKANNDLTNMTKENQDLIMKNQKMIEDNIKKSN